MPTAQLAEDAKVSTRYLSFMATGKALAGRNMVMTPTAEASS